MFELLLVAGVNDRACEHVRAPVSATDEAASAAQAAPITDMAHATFGSFGALSPRDGGVLAAAAALLIARPGNSS